MGLKETFLLPCSALTRRLAVFQTHPDTHSSVLALVGLSWKRQDGQVSSRHVACCWGRGEPGRKDVLCHRCPHYCPPCWHWPIVALPSGVHCCGSLGCAACAAAPQIQTIGLGGLATSRLHLPTGLCRNFFFLFVNLESGFAYHEQDVVMFVVFQKLHTLETVCPHQPRSVVKIRFSKICYLHQSGKDISQWAEGGNCEEIHECLKVQTGW